MRRYIPIEEMKEIENIINKDDGNDNNDDNDDDDDDKDDNMNINKNSKIINLDEKEEIDNNNIFNNNDYFKFQIYNNDLKYEKLDSNDDIPYLDVNLEKSLKAFVINKKGDYLKKANKHTKSNIFKSEFITTENDIIGFFRSCYLNNDFLKNKKWPEDFILKTLFYEFQGLFKSYRVYKLFISQFTEVLAFPNNIIEIGNFILQFMKKYNKYGIRYFLIFDSISQDLLEDLKIFEKDAKNDNNCFIIELFKNDKINNFFEENVIHEKIEKNILILYSQYFSCLDLIEDVKLSEKDFLNDNFGESLYYYQRYKDWKKKKYNNIDYNDFLLETKSEIENDLSKVFVDNEEAKAFYKYIYLNITYNNEVEEKIIKNLNLDYFFIEKKDGKLKLKTFPFIKDIVMDISKEKIASLLNTQFFIKCDDYIKGGIIEDIAKEEIKNIFKMNAKNKNDFQEVDIHRLLDNEIYTLYTPEIVKLILKKKKKLSKNKRKV